MMRVPLPDGGEFAVIEPGNIQRLKEGRPLKVGNCLVAFTPDMEAFMKLLGANGDLPERGELKLIELKTPVTPEQIQEALKACQQMPEVLR